MSFGTDGNFGYNDARKVFYDKESYNINTKEWTTSRGQDSSGLFSYLYLKSAMNCQRYQNPQACQTLANLCVLTMYDEQQTACELYKQITEDGFMKGYPSIYMNKETNDKVLSYGNTPIKFRVSLNEENKEMGIEKSLHFYLGKYDIHGNFYGFEPMTNQLFLCDIPAEEVEKVFLVGNTVEIGCQFDVSTLSNKYLDHPRNENFFYELYLQDYDGTLIEIPVLIENIQKDSGAKPNEFDVEADWILTKRFFLFDTLSGIENESDFPHGEPKTVQYAKSIELIIKLEPKTAEKISLPILKIGYRARAVSSINDGGE